MRPFVYSKVNAEQRQIALTNIHAYGCNGKWRLQTYMFMAVLTKQFTHRNAKHKTCVMAALCSYWNLSLTYRLTLAMCKLEACL